MAQPLTDEEQLQLLKNWWREQGSTLVIIVTLLVGAYFAWQWWARYQTQSTEAASAVYSELLEAVQSIEQSSLVNAAADNEALIEQKKKCAISY